MVQYIMNRIMGETWSIIYQGLPRGPGFASGAWPFIRQLPNFLILSILCASVYVRVCERVHVRLSTVYNNIDAALE